MDTDRQGPLRTPGQATRVFATPSRSSKTWQKAVARKSPKAAQTCVTFLTTRPDLRVRGRGGKTFCSRTLLLRFDQRHSLSSSIINITVIINSSISISVSVVDLVALGQYHRYGCYLVSIVYLHPDGYRS